MLAKSLRKSSDRRGVAAVELAILLPFLTFIALATIDFCRVFYYAMTVENCARNGAVYASEVFNTDAQYASIAAATISDGQSLRPAMSTANVSTANATDADGNAVIRVTVTYTFNTITSYPGIPSSVTLTRTEQARVAPAAPTVP